MTSLKSKPLKIVKRSPVFFQLVVCRPAIQNTTKRKSLTYWLGSRIEQHKNTNKLINKSTWFICLSAGLTHGAPPLGCCDVRSTNRKAEGAEVKVTVATVAGMTLTHRFPCVFLTLPRDEEWLPLPPPPPPPPPLLMDDASVSWGMGSVDA